MYCIARVKCQVDVGGRDVGAQRGGLLGGTSAHGLVDRLRINILFQLGIGEREEGGVMCTAEYMVREAAEDDC